MTSRDYIKLNRSGLDFLVLVLQSSNSLFWMTFSILLQFLSSCLHGFMFSFCLWGLVVLLVCSPWEEWSFWNFCLKASHCFPVKTLYFRGPFIFCTFCLWSWGFEIAPLRGSPVNVIGHAMTSQDYIKVEQVRAYLLSSCLAEFKQFYSERFFQFCFS